MGWRMSLPFRGEFGIIDVHFLISGTNPRITDQIKVIVDTRLEAKKAGTDGHHQAYKLLMNSSYGTLIENTRD